MRRMFLRRVVTTARGIDYANTFRFSQDQYIADETHPWRHETDEDLQKRIPKNALFYPVSLVDTLKDRLDVIPSAHADGDQNRNP